MRGITERKRGVKKRRGIESDELKRGEMMTGFEERSRGRKRRDEKIEGKMIRKGDE